MKFMNIDEAMNSCIENVPFEKFIHSDDPAFTTSHTFSIARLDTNSGKYEMLYEFIPDIRITYLLAQHAMDHDRPSDDDLIIIFPGFNVHSNMLPNSQLISFIELLAHEYSVNKPDTGSDDGSHMAEKMLDCAER